MNNDEISMFLHYQKDFIVYLVAQVYSLLTIKTYEAVLKEINAYISKGFKSINEILLVCCHSAKKYNKFAYVLNSYRKFIQKNIIPSTI